MNLNYVFNIEDLSSISNNTFAEDIDIASSNIERIKFTFKSSSAGVIFTDKRIFFLFKSNDISKTSASNQNYKCWSIPFSEIKIYSFEINESNDSKYTHEKDVIELLVKDFGNIRLTFRDISVYSFEELCVLLSNASLGEDVNFAGLRTAFY